MSYADFLAAKTRRVADHGHHVDLSDVHPMLHDWQARIVQWAASKGRGAVFADTGLGKTFIQVEWARLSADRALIVAPLSVARQTVREARKIGVDVGYVRDGADVAAPGVYATNYEMVERFDPADFGAVVLDESSCLANVDAKRRRILTEWARTVPRRLACTATPVPNDVAEIVNHADWLGAMPRAEMLAAYFVHDSDTGWRLKGHAADAMYQWMASWSVALRRPSDIGYPDGGYLLPPLSIVEDVVDATVESDGQLFATDLGGVGGRAAVRRQTLDARAARAVELAARGQWIVWCGLNDESRTVAASLDGAVNVEGSWTPDAKADALESFQDGGIRVLVTKPSIAGFGMNFQNCHQMAFVGLSDSWQSYYQAVRRCWRYGQPEPVTAHVVVSPIESQIVANIKRKERAAALMIDRLVHHMAAVHSRQKEYA